MKKALFSILIALFFATQSNAQSTVTIGSTTVQIDTAYTGLNVPWEIIYGPDKHLWVTERGGVVSRINPVSKTKTVILNISNSIFALSEAGLLGMTLDSDFTANQQVYLVYTFGTNNSIFERLVKYTYSGGNLNNPQILIDSIPGAINHDGARLLFLPDKTLLMSTGDALNTSLPQNLNSKCGKILRLNTDGSIPSSNPFPNSYVYSYGHRNPQGMMLAPNGLVYISEHGPNNDDEVQVLESGRNYGWPNVEGFCNTAAEITFCTANNVKEPIFGWTPTIAPNDLTWYTNPGLPEFDGGIIMAVLKDKKLVSLKFNAAGTGSVSQNSYLVNQYGRIRDVCVGPANEIYFATNGNGTGDDANTHSIFVLKPVNVVSLSEQTLTNNLRIYPSLVNDILHVDFIQSKAIDYSITITNMMGKNCLHGPLAESATDLNLTDLPPGLYIVSVQGRDNTIHRLKIIKN